MRRTLTAEADHVAALICRTGAAFALLADSAARCRDLWADHDSAARDLLERLARVPAKLEAAPQVTA